MVDVRPNQLPSATTVTNTDKLVLDQGAAGVNSASPSELFDVFSPLASQAEAEQGTDNNKRMTPLRTKQSIASEVGTTIASAASGTLANSAVQPDRTITAGTGLEGGGDLSVNRTIALNSASQLSLGRANSAIQKINGKTGNDIDLVKADIGLGNVDNTSDTAKPVSTAQATAIALKANNATTVTAGTGLTGGGDLSANRTVALNAASIASLAKADTALQAPGGVLGQIIVKQSAALNDVAWATSEAATAVSYGPQTLSAAQQGQARANIGAGTNSYNWIINGDFTINQRGGIKKPSNGVYGYDRWKGHASGVEQVIEGLPAGEYTLTWTGGGNGVFGGVTSTSPIKTTVTGGNTSVVVSQAATKVSVVLGDASSEFDPFSPRHIQQELALCQRYYRQETLALGGYAATIGGTVRSSVTFQAMRTSPSVLVVAEGQRLNINVVTFGLRSNSSALFQASSTAIGLIGLDNYVVALDAEI